MIPNNIRSYLYGEFAQDIRSAVDSYMDGTAKQGNKQAVKAFIESHLKEVRDAAMQASEHVICEAQRLRDEAQTMRAHVSSLEQDIVLLEQKRDTLQKEVDELNEKFCDPKLREAFRLFQEVSKSPGDDSLYGPKEDAYTKQRRITAAGIMAAAYLGMQVYSPGGGRTPKEDAAQ